MELAYLRSLLELSKDEVDPGRAWPLLVQSRVEGQDTDEAISFLEDLLSPATKIARPIKHAARAAYQKAARTTTVDIKEQEENLGLPFQSGA
jgi:ribosomal protein L12E/L44/L45/RPP1/RPP2